MTRKTATQEIEGRIELLGKQMSEANKDAAEFRRMASDRDAAFEALNTLRNEYVGLLEDSGATSPKVSIRVHADVAKERADEVAAQMTKQIRNYPNLGY